jgi:prepilin-type N-terminal cleavage/methylation domain-containing protein
MKTRKAFTLVEMLVVIMIIALLAAALFPAISSAIDAARATAAKTKGRGIWAAIVQCNAEREPLGMPTVWPANFGFTNKYSTDYFIYLMSDGSNPGTPVATDDDADRVASDLKPDVLCVSGPGCVSAAKASEFKPQNNGWSVFSVGDQHDAGAPLLVTRNVRFGSIGLDAGGQPVSTNNSSALPIDVTPELNVKRGVWVTRGGGTFDARKKYMMSAAQPLLSGTNSYLWVTPGPNQ